MHSFSSNFVLSPLKKQCSWPYFMVMLTFLTDRSDSVAFDATTALGALQNKTVEVSQSLGHGNGINPLAGVFLVYQKKTALDPGL